MCIGFYDLNEFLWTYTSDAAVAVFNFCIHLSCHCGHGICQKGLLEQTRAAKCLVRLRIMRSRTRHFAVRHTILEIPGSEPFNHSVHPRNFTFALFDWEVQLIQYKVCFFWYPRFMQLNTRARVALMTRKLDTFLPPMVNATIVQLQGGYSRLLLTICPSDTYFIFCISWAIAFTKSLIQCT